MRDYTRNQMDHFRQQLQLLILGKGLTRKELSKKLNRNQNTIQQWITNKNIKPAHVQELCKFCNIHLNERGREAGQFRLERVIEDEK